MCCLALFAASTEILLDMVGRLNSPKVALVHQMPYTTDQAGLAAAVEKVTRLLQRPAYYGLSYPGGKDTGCIHKKYKQLCFFLLFFYYIK